MEKFNLLHLKTSANIGGAEVMLTFWPKYLDSDKFKQFVIFAEDGPLMKIMEDLGVEVFCFKRLKGAKGFIEIPKLRKFIKDKKINLIHAHGARVNLWGSIVSFLTDVPIISTEHGIDFWRYNNYLFNLLDKFSIKVNKFRVGVSLSVCEMLKEHGVKVEKIICIENGIEIERFDISIDISAKKIDLGIPPDSRIIGTVGRLAEQKGHKYLIEAFRLIKDQFSDIRLLIVGDGPLREALTKQVRNLELDRKVIFTGQRDDIPELMAIMDVFVLPSITEGLPLVLLEAMAARKPIVASAVSGISEVIENGVDGILVEPKNPQMLKEKLMMLLTDKNLTSLISNRAKEKSILKYNARDMIENYKKLYLKILTNSMRY